MKKNSTKKAPWTKSPPKKSKPTSLSAQSKKKARSSAAKAGRHYPNLVDNMNAAKKQKAAKR